jgi:hypothetical protein
MPARYSYRRLSWAGPLATSLAIFANALYYQISKAFGEKYILPLDGTASHLGAMPFLMVAWATLVAGLLATLLFACLLRFARKPVTVFLSVAVTALLVSFGGPFSLPAGELQTKLLLSGMQIITAVLITAGILLLGQKRTPRA